MSSILPRHDARVRTKTQKQKQREQKDRERKHKGRLQVSTKKYKQIYMMHEQINVMMHALM